MSSNEAPRGGEGGAGTGPTGLSAAAASFTPGPAATPASGPSSRRRRGPSGTGTNNTRRGGGGRINVDQGLGGPSSAPASAAPAAPAGGRTNIDPQEGTNSRRGSGSSKRIRGGRGGRGRGRGGGRGGGARVANSRNAGHGAGAGAAGRGGGGGGAGGAGGDESDGDGAPLCVVCASEIEFFAVGECNHPGRCSTCAVRSRVLFKDRSCPECKTVLDRLVVARLPASGEGAPPFESFNLWGDTTGPDSKFDDDSGMVFHACQEHHDSLLRARDLYCPVPGCTGASPSAAEGAGGRGRGRKRGIGGLELFPNRDALVEHMKMCHQRCLCILCLENRALFVSEQEVFTASGLRKHEARVEGGHPLCRFCSKRFFDNTALYEHMTGTHINCHLCPEENQHRYFRGEPQLRDHLRTSHFLCDRGECRRQGVVNAFNTPQEFQAHLLEDHGIADRRAVPAGGVGFSVRRAARDGTGLHGSTMETTPLPGSHLPLPTRSWTLQGASWSPCPPRTTEDAGPPVPLVVVVRGAGLARDSAGGHEEEEGGAAAAAAARRGIGEEGGEELQQQRRRRRRSRRFRPRCRGPPAGGGGGGGAQQERHEFSLVGKTLRPRPKTDHQQQHKSPGDAGGGAAAGYGGAGGGGGSEEEEKERRQLLRNKRLADALGIRAALGAGAAIGGAKVGTTASGATVAMGLGEGLEALREHLTRANYSTSLVAWARANRTQLLKLERRLAELVVDRKGTSTQLKPMPSVDRKAAHELAVYYGLLTQSFDLEPKRYVSVIKQKGCRIPSPLLSTATKDPGYKGTDEAPTEGNANGNAASAPALERTSTNPNPRAAALLGPKSAPATGGGDGSSVGLSPPPPVGGAGPRTSTVVSISSADPLAVDPAAAAAAAAEAESKKPFYQRSKRRGVLPPQGAGSALSTAAAAATTSGPPPPPPSSASASASANYAEPAQAGQKEAGIAAVDNNGSAAASEDRDKNAVAAAIGPSNPESLLIFHSMQAGLAGGDAVLASVRKLVPSRTVVGVRPATSVEASAAGVQGHRGGGGGSGGALVMEFTTETNARRAWEKIEKEAQQLEAAARVTRADYHPPFRAKLYPSPPASAGAGGAASAGAGGGKKAGGGLDVVRDNWDDSSDDDEEEEEEAGGSDGQQGTVLDESTNGGETAVLDKERGEQEQQQQQQEQEQQQESDASGAGVDADGLAVAPSGAATPSAAAAAAATAAETTAAAVGSSSSVVGGSGKRHSKWGNSAIKGTLSRPSDGRATTVELEAAARKDRLEKLRRLEEARRENRQKRDQDRRAERADAGKLDAHAFVWENLGGDDSSTESSSSSDEGGGGGGGGGNATQRLEQPPAAPGTAKKVEGDATAAATAVGDPPEGGGRGEGWACGSCTFWNTTEGSDCSGGGSVRCGVCEAEGPRNARSPWLPA